jgi:hypothetical protein
MIKSFLLKFCPWYRNHADQARQIKLLQDQIKGIWDQRRSADPPEDHDLLFLAFSLTCHGLAKELYGDPQAWVVVARAMLAGAREMPGHTHSHYLEMRPALMLEKSHLSKVTNQLEELYSQG